MHSVEILLSFVMLLAVSGAFGQQTNIVFPSEDTNRNRTATHNRKPVLDSTKCDQNSELLYPGDHETDWVCDCKPGFLYHPSTQKCYRPYTRGPCNDGQYLVLIGSSSIPKCVLNPCRYEGYVLFQDKCVLLNSENSCEEYKKLIGRKVQLVVDPTTLQLTCRDEDDKFKCENNCCIGSARYSYGKCDHLKGQSTKI